jgi:hypothetical protein
MDQSITVEEIFLRDFTRLEELVGSCPDFIDGVPFEDYKRATIKCISEGARIGAETIVNYLPLGHNILLRAETIIPQSVILSKDIHKVMSESAVKFIIVGYGEKIENVSLFATADIRSSEMLYRRPFIIHNNSLSSWTRKIEKEKESGIINTLSQAEDKSKAGKFAVRDMDAPIVETSESGRVEIAYGKKVKVVEYFITDYVNVIGIYGALQRVHESSN